MGFVPGLGLLPSPPIWHMFSEQISNILAQRRLVVLGKQKADPAQPMNLGTQRALGMHRMGESGYALSPSRGQQGLERTDLILLLPNIARPTACAMS
jgi:hypothetical protein